MTEQEYALNVARERIRWQISQIRQAEAAKKETHLNPAASSLDMLRADGRYEIEISEFRLQWQNVEMLLKHGRL